MGRIEEIDATRLSASPWYGLFDDSPPLTYADGTILFRQDDPAEEVFLLERGLVKLVFLDPGGEEFIAQLCMSPGSLIGDSCSVLRRHYISATVVMHNTRLRRMAAAPFAARVRRDAELSWLLHEAHCAQHADLLDRSAQLGYMAVRQRVEHLLWSLADACELLPTAKGQRMQLPLKYRELAQLIKVSPEHLCRMIAAIEKDGIIRRDKGWLYLIDRDRLFHHKHC